MSEPRGSTESAAQHVLVVAPQPFYADRGTPITTRYLIKALQELGYHVDVLTYPFGDALDLPGVELTRIPNPLGVRWVPIGFSWRKLWLDLFLFRAIAQRLETKRYACVSASEESAFVATLVAPRFGVPVLYDMQSSLAEQMGHLLPFRNGLSSRLLNQCERWLIDHANLTVTSAGLAERVRAACPAASVREWQYPGLTEPARMEEVGALRSELSLNGTGPVVLYSGSFATYQGLPDLVGAMPSVLREAPDTVLVLVGGGSEAELQRVRKMTGDLPERSVRVLAQRPREDMPRFLGLADIVVSPRRYGENLPLKTLDYMGSGRAIVATDIPAHRTVLNASRAVLVKPGDAGSLAAGVSALAADVELRRKLGSAAKEYAERHLGWLGYVLCVGDAFKQLCGNDRTL